MLENIVASILATGAVVVAVLRFWGGEWIKNAFAKDLEEHRAKLNATVDKELEKYKAELNTENAAATERLRAGLQIAAAEHHVRFSKLHEKAAEVAAETFRLLEAPKNAVGNYVSEFNVSPRRTVDEEFTDVKRAYAEFFTYYQPHRLYLPKYLADEIQEFHRKMQGLTMRFSRYLLQKDKPAGPQPSEDMWGKIVDDFDLVVAPLFEGLEREFRRLLGVSD